MGNRYALLLGGNHRVAGFDLPGKGIDRLRDVLSSSIIGGFKSIECTYSETQDTIFRKIEEAFRRGLEDDQLIYAVGLLCKESRDGALSLLLSVDQSDDATVVEIPIAFIRKLISLSQSRKHLLVLDLFSVERDADGKLNASPELYRKLSIMDFCELSSKLTVLIGFEGTKLGDKLQHGWLIRAFLRTLVDPPPDKPLETSHDLFAALCSEIRQSTASRFDHLPLLTHDPKHLLFDKISHTEGDHCIHSEENSASTSLAPPNRIRIDDNIQFSVYRPQWIEPMQWYPLLCFAHLAERRPGTPSDTPDPRAQVELIAKQTLGDLAGEYSRLVQDSSLAIPKAGEISFVPEVEGIEFDPPQRSFFWLEDIHKEEFRFCASDVLDGKAVNGVVTVYLGVMVLAVLDLSIVITSKAAQSVSPTVRQYFRPYRKIFPSYSHEDTKMVEHITDCAKAIGDEYLQDVIALRSGELWSKRLHELIDNADLFQLFWSRNSMNSHNVREEWEYALSLRRPGFIRPTYWEKPMPREPAKKLPPDDLAQLHFHCLPISKEQPPPPPDESRDGVKKSSDSRTLMAQGVNILANAVKVTLGPKGRNAVLDKSFGAPPSLKTAYPLPKKSN